MVRRRVAPPSATSKPCLNLSIYTAPQTISVCHAYLGAAHHGNDPSLKQDCDSGYLLGPG